MAKIEKVDLAKWQKIYLERIQIQYKSKLRIASPDEARIMTLEFEESPIYWAAMDNIRVVDIMNEMLFGEDEPQELMNVDQIERQFNRAKKELARLNGEVA